MEKTAQIQLFMNMERCVHSKIATLVKNLHDGCLLVYDDLSTVVLCPRVSSKAVRVGPLFSTPSTSWPRKLLRTNCVMKAFKSLPASSGELWDRDTAVVTARERSLRRQSGVHHNVEEILDVYFLDDGCYMIAHKQVAELVKRMCLLVATIVSIFS